MHRLSVMLQCIAGAIAATVLLHALVEGLPTAIRLSFETWPTLSANATRYAVWALAVYTYGKLSTR